MLYLTLDSCQAAGAGLWLTKASAVTSTGLPGEPQGVKLLFLLPVDALHPSRLEESLTLPGGVRLKERSVLQVSVADVDVVVRDLVHCQRVGLSLVDGPAGDQLESTDKVRQLLRRQEVQEKQETHSLCASKSAISPLSGARGASLGACAVAPAHAQPTCIFGGCCASASCPAWRRRGWARW